MSWVPIPLPHGDLSVTNSDLAIASRFPDHLQVFSITADGAVMRHWWYSGTPTWGSGTIPLAPPGSAAPGSLAAFSRNSATMEVWFVHPKYRSICYLHWDEQAFWSPIKYLTAINTADPGASLRIMSSRPGVVELFWVNPTGEFRCLSSGQDKTWELASVMKGQKQSKADPRGGLAVTTYLSRDGRRHGFLCWTAPSGAIHFAWLGDSQSPAPVNCLGLEPLAPPGTVSARSALSLCVDSPADKKLRVFWISKDGDVDYAALDLDISSQWENGTIAKAPSIRPECGLKVLHRNQDNLELQWVSQDNKLCGACWYRSGSWAGWKVFGTVCASQQDDHVDPQTRIASFSRTPQTMQAFFVGQDGHLGGFCWGEAPGTYA